MKTTTVFFSSLMMAISLFVFTVPVKAAPPALSIASFIKYKLSFAQCQKKAIDAMETMNLEIDNHGNGTIAGYGEQSVAVVNCYQTYDKLFIQLAVSSQKDAVAETIMHNLVSYLRGGVDEPPNPSELEPEPKK